MVIWQALLDGLSVLSEKWTVVLGAVSVACLACSVSFFLSRKTTEEKAIFRRSGLLAGFFFVLSVILRLTFLTEAFVPPYFDSVEHYRIIKEIATALETSTLLETVPALTPNYYHLGFHVLASFLAFGLHANPIDVILVLGQVILAAIPIPIYFLIRQETRSDAAAFFSMLLAGFGWYMPGFAVNWGKYPALAGLLSLEIVLSIAYFIARKKSISNQLALIGFLLLGIIVSTLFHTRALVVIAISIASWLIAEKMQNIFKTLFRWVILPARVQARVSRAEGNLRLSREILTEKGESSPPPVAQNDIQDSFQTPSKVFQYLLLGILLAGILVFGKIIQAETLLNLTLEPYLGDGLWVTLTVLTLSPFALIKFPHGVYFSVLFILSVFVTLFIPVGALSPGLENQTLLDRPFVEMVLYLPLSILGGLGLAGLLQVLKSITALPEKAHLYTRVLITTLLLGFTGVLSIESYDFYPSDCCNFVGYDDTVALDWLSKNIPPGAHILIAATQMNVLPTGPSASLVGTDAGIWIPALTGRSISLAAFETDFRSTSTLEQLCQLQINYVYVGGTDQKFNAAQLNEKAEWYKGILFLPNAQLYRLTGCSQ